MQSFLLAALVASKGIEAQHTLSNCGSSGDHLVFSSLRSSPDPVVGGESFTLWLDGTLDEDITAGALDVDLNIEALGIINSPVKKNVDFSYTPGLVKGPVAIKIGPLKLPWLPGTNKITGTLKLSDANKEAVFCLGVNLALMETPKPPALPRADPVSSCSSSTDHIKSLSWATVDDQTTVTGDLDEHVSTFDVVVNTHIAIGWFPIPVAFTAPFTFTPGFTQGPFTLKVGSPTAEEESPKVGTDLAGTIKINDGKGEEIMCLKMDIPLATKVVV